MTNQTKGGANALGSTNDPAWNGSDTDATVIALLKAIQDAAGDAGGTPAAGGSTTEVQYNNAGDLDGADIVYDKLAGVVARLTMGLAGEANAQIRGQTGTATGTGTGLLLDAGDGGATSGAGGVTQVRGGGATDGNGGGVAITGRNGTGTNRNGGSITFTAGTATGSGTRGAVQLASELCVQQSATAPAIANAGTITTAVLGTSRLAPAGAVTGIIMEPGIRAGQTVTVINESAAASTITMAVAATSNVANGVTTVIAGLTAKRFVWNSITSRWYECT